MAGALINLQVGADLRLFRVLQNPALMAALILLVAVLAWSVVAGVGVPGPTALAGILFRACAGRGLLATTYPVNWWLIRSGIKEKM